MDINGPGSVLAAPQALYRTGMTVA